jgi:hypothetical protein
MKGVFEWKILAAIFAVLIVASSALVSNSGIKDMFLNSTGSLGDWMEGSPFDSLFQTPEKTTNAVVISLVNENIELEVTEPVNITMGKSSIMNFRGMLNVLFESNMTELKPSDSDLVMNIKLEETEIKNIKIPIFILEDTDFTVSSEKTDITASDDKIEIYDFHGDIRITDAFELTGNVSKVKDDKWSIG